jgi:NAD(P)-dependent dehydrogenase (short-subunit alcohol dehydrogenase family)
VITTDRTADTILDTGGAGSIGADIARDLAAGGAFVMAADLSADATRAVADEIVAAGGLAQGWVMDVRSTESVNDVARALLEAGIVLTGLVNAAGILRTGALEAMTDEASQEIFDVNVTGIFRTTRAVAPILIAAGRGAIVNLSSVSAFIGSADGAAYTSTKGAVLSFNSGKAGELAPHGIRVNAVCPGWVDGGFTHQAMEASDDPASLVDMAASLHPLGRMASPADVAHAVTFLMSDRASFITGTPLFVDGGFMVQRGVRS